MSIDSAEGDCGAVVDQESRKIGRKATEIKRKKLKEEWKSDEIFINQQSKPFAKRPFRIVRMYEEVD